MVLRPRSVGYDEHLVIFRNQALACIVLKDGRVLRNPWVVWAVKVDCVNSGIALQPTFGRDQFITQPVRFELLQVSLS